MSITALPSQTVRAIGSAQALTDSASLVKELVDNALDAQAASIAIEISADALHIIQVKDNGHGVAPIDRPLVCKRYCTSKIKNLDDLANIGGASLGFRGEALASAVDMSGGLTITTRIVGEATAVSLKVSQNAEVANEDRVSHAVGTTVRITDFLKSLPVRRQTAIKESGKQLAKIKRTLQAYALARPSVRLSLKVLKAKSDKGNWVYAPKSDASVSDAAVKIVGKRVSDQCRWVVWSPGNLPTKEGATQDENTNSSTQSESTYKVEALVPASKADSSAISSTGHYVSVDSRPVSCTRGTLKQILQLYKSYVRSSCCTSTDQKIIDPFLCMNIVCPPGSYDANVEPAKDDVLFTDSPRVLEIVEDFFKCQYGVLQPSNKPTINGKSKTVGPRSFDLLLARKAPSATTKPPISDQDPGNSFPSTSASPTVGPNPLTAIPEIVPAGSQIQPDEGIVDEIGAIRHRAGEAHSEAAQSSAIRLPNHKDQRWRQSMFGDENSDGVTNDHETPPHQDLEDEEDLRDISVSNPWTFAKLSAPLRPQKPSPNELISSSSSNHQLLTPAKQHGGLGHDLSSPDVHLGSVGDINLPTPVRSQNNTSDLSSPPDTFPYPIKRWGKGQLKADPLSDTTLNEDQSSPNHLDTWIQAPTPRRTMDQDLSSKSNDMVLPRPQRDFVPASELAKGTPLNAIPEITQAPRRRFASQKQQQPNSDNANANKPFKPPAVQDPTRVWFDDLPSTAPPRRFTKAKDNSLPARPMNGEPASLAHDPIDTDDETPSQQPQQQHQGLALTMDYEARKAAATAQRRALLREQSRSNGSRHLQPPTPEPGTQIKISPSQQSSPPMPPTSSSPHRNRYNSAVAALHATTSALQTSKDIATASATNDADINDADLDDIPTEKLMDPKDPRAYLIRCLRINANANGRNPAGHIKRIKSSLLPLEYTSSSNPNTGTYTRNLIQIIPGGTLIASLPTQMQTHGKADAYINGWIDAPDSLGNASGRELQRWEDKGMEMVKEMYHGL
ncbi:MAG: hypothetical protein Q9200_004964 [Gallowayella weberi]